jgi:hypothetical protein
MVGELGDGTLTYRYTPTRIGTDSNWKFIVAVRYHTVAIKKDSSLWAWGWNDRGQLGDGTTTNRNTPTRIGTGNDWATIADGSAVHTVAIKTDGSLFAWGWNLYGQLGDVTTTNRLTPTLILAGTIPTISGTMSTSVGGSSTLTGSDTADATTPWTSSNTAVATVSITGVVSGVSAGTTTTTYQNNLGCTIAAIFTVIAPSDISDFVVNNQIKIYPNPTQAIVHIGSRISINVQVTDVVGRVVFEGKNPTTINLQNFADGTYIFRISDEHNNLIKVDKINKVE